MFAGGGSSRFTIFEFPLCLAQIVYLCREVFLYFITYCVVGELRACRDKQVFLRRSLLDLLLTKSEDGS